MTPVPVRPVPVPVRTSPVPVRPVPVPVRPVPAPVRPVPVPVLPVPAPVRPVPVPVRPVPVPVSGSDDSKKNGPVTDPAIIKALLDEHNKFRTEGQPALTWNAQLAQMAVAVAATTGDACDLEHSDLPCGENLAQDNIDIRSETLINALVRGVVMWTDERVSACSGGGHYTQVIWKSTRQVGCAFYKCPGSTFQPVVLACEYDPAGNSGANPCTATSPTSSCITSGLSRAGSVQTVSEQPTSSNTRTGQVGSPGSTTSEEESSTPGWAIALLVLGSVMVVSLFAIVIVVGTRKPSAERF